jgi:glyoxylase-like metal-dependent hydrolase (beta-lactamase superfamily II)
MKIEQIIVGSLETNCYILKKETMGLIIDPGDEPEKILFAATGLRVELILATHKHYDHITALRSVKNATKARAAIHPLDWTDGFDLKLMDGQILDFCAEPITVIHTPGHTPGSCCFLWNDILFSGDTLFPGGPGTTAYDGNEQAIYKSIREKLLVLPDTTKVYPGHGPATTIGRERSLY